MLERALALSKLKAYLSDIGAQIAVDVIDAAPNSVLNGMNPFVYRIFCGLVTHRLARLTTRCVTFARACLYHRLITTAIATLTTIASAYATILLTRAPSRNITHTCRARRALPCGSSPRGQADKGGLCGGSHTRASWGIPITYQMVPSQKDRSQEELFCGCGRALRRWRAVDGPARVVVAVRSSILIWHARVDTRE